MTYWYEILFYAVFLCQIVLISWFIPRTIINRMQKVLTTYPPEQYPRLYPKSRDFYVIWHWVFKVATAIVFLLGIVALFLMLFVVDHSTFASDGYISEAWPGIYGLLQFLPLVAVAYLEHQTTKLMRLAHPPTTRKAELRPRRLLEFVSPQLLGLGIVAFVVVTCLDLFIHDSSGIVLGLVFGQIIFFGTGAKCFYGRKQDPHQSVDDRNAQLKPVLRSLVFGSIAMSIYFATVILDDVYDLDYLDAILISVYYQAIVLLSIGYTLRSIKLDEVNFDVYKDSQGVAS